MCTLYKVLISMIIHSVEHSSSPSDDLRPSKSKEKKCELMKDAVKVERSDYNLPPFLPPSLTPIPGGITEEDKKRTTQLISHYKEGREFHTLKEPRSLFYKPHGALTQQSKKPLPLWPAEVPCLPHKLKFITTPPPYPEPFYRQG